MSPRNQRSASKKRNKPSSPDSPNGSPKKLRRSSRLNSIDGGSASTEAQTEERAEERTESLSKPKGNPAVTRTPASSPPPQDTQIASQFYYPPLSEAGINGNDETVWGYLWPLNQKERDVIKLDKSPAISTATPPKGSKKKGGTPKKPPTSGFLVGRHPECDLVIDAVVISNRHCVIFKVVLSPTHLASPARQSRIIANRARWKQSVSGSQPIAVLEDISSNGTWVNSVIVGRNNRRTLQNGDEIEFAGGYQFTFRYPPHMQSSPFRGAYDLGKQLGSGHFATVHLAVDKKSGKEFAVKIFRKRRNEDQARTSGLQQEIAVLMSVSHPNILCLQGTYDEDDGVYLVLELAKEGELFNHIIHNTKLTEADTRKIFKQLCNGLHYLHERNIVHRDIKPENILLCDRQLTAKLADFGLAKIIGEDSFTTSLCGTPSYVAPEVLENSRDRKYTRAVDMWSLGVVLYICLCGFPPFSDELCTPDSPYNLSQQIKQGRYDFPSPYWDSIGDPALDLIERMLEVNPTRRITVEHMMKHAWITEGEFNPAESYNSLVGALETMGLKRSKAFRERTLLADRHGPGPTTIAKAPIAAHQGKKGKQKGIEKAEVREGNPSDMAAGTKAFMHVGGKGGDETLYPDDSYSEDV